MKNICRYCKNYKKKRSYYFNNKIHICLYNSKKENYNKILRCNRENEFLGFERKGKKQ